MHKKVSNILSILDAKYGKVKAFLNHETPFQLLVAVILSAQTTDNLINKITPELFKKYPDATSLSQAEIQDLENLIKKVNYYKTKAKHLIQTTKIIEEKFQGHIPKSISELITLHGVGRKVANVILAEIYNIPEGIVVDTHVKRVSYRIGWTDSNNPAIIELDLMKIIPKDHFVNLPKHLILIGRNYCFPKNPDCKNCPIEKYCQKRIIYTSKSNSERKTV